MSKTKIKCVCSSVILRRSLNDHLKTKKHHSIIEHMKATTDDLKECNRKIEEFMKEVAGSNLGAKEENILNKISKKKGVSFKDKSSTLHYIPEPKKISRSMIAKPVYNIDNEKTVTKKGTVKPADYYDKKK